MSIISFLMEHPRWLMLVLITLLVLVGVMCLEVGAQSVVVRTLTIDVATYPLDNPSLLCIDGQAAAVKGCTAEVPSRLIFRGDWKGVELCMEDEVHCRTLPYFTVPVR